jgi:prophage antirepressor-like protein
MTDILEVFESEEFGVIEMISIEGELHYRATQVALALGYGNPRDAVNKFCNNIVLQKKIAGTRTYKVNYIPEIDVLTLISKGQKASADKKQRLIEYLGLEHKFVIESRKEYWLEYIMQLLHKKINE